MISRSVLLVVVAGMAAASAARAETYVIDGRHTLVQFSVERLGFSNTLGWFREISGEVNFEESAPENSSVTIAIETDSIDTNFEARDVWLRSDKMLNADAHPIITFVSKTIDISGDNTGVITGDLTLNGVTKPVSLDTTFNKKGMNPIDNVETIGFSATGSLKRSDFEITEFLGPLADDVALEIQLEAALPKPE